MLIARAETTITATASQIAKNKMSSNSWGEYQGAITGFRFETKADKKCPTATQDIAVNLRNRGKAIKTAIQVSVDV